MVRLLAGAALATALLVLGGSAAASAADSASFDWSMPERYTGTDGDGDGRVDSFEPDGALEVAPDGFRVDFTGSGAACSAHSTLWSVEGDRVAADDPDVVGGDPASCGFSYRFAREGTYEVTLEGRDEAGERVAEATELVHVQDFLVVSLGDSVASGEGNPDVAGLPARWQDEQCHRSALAGPALAARALEAGDPRTSVTFVHLACSGATIDSGLLGGYQGIVPGPILPPQVEVLEELASRREVDAVLISIGANDVRFSEIVKDCFKFPECHRPESLFSVTQDFEARRQTLAGRYAALASRLGSLDLPHERVHLSEYFDPTRDRAGEPCPGDEPGSIGILGDHPAALAGPLAAGGALGPVLPGGAAGGVGAIVAAHAFQISREEAEWASVLMLASLNAEVAGAASAHGWEYVGGIAQPFRAHGYCASGGEHWVVRWQESMDRQNDENGTIHPNAPGHDLYGDRLVARITPALFTGQVPRRPRQRLETQGRTSGEFLDIVESVDAGDTVSIRARVTGPDNTGRGITFALQGPGTLETAASTTDHDGEATITYTAPEHVDEDDRAHVTATLIDGGGQALEDSVRIELERLPIEVTIDPTVATLSRGEQRAFTAAVTNTTEDAVTWSATGGGITQDGTYTAGQTSGEFSVTATSVADPSRTAKATVKIIGYSIWGPYENGTPYVFHQVSIAPHLVQFRFNCYVWFDPHLPATGGEFSAPDAWCSTQLRPEPFFGWWPDTGEKVKSRITGSVGAEGLTYTLSYYDREEGWQVHERFTGNRCSLSSYPEGPDGPPPCNETVDQEPEPEPEADSGTEEGSDGGGFGESGGGGGSGEAP